MEIINRRSRIASISRDLRRQDQKIGFVPTMGTLHEGHLSLIDCARRMSDKVIVSIFVNPAQFNEQEDYENYGRDLTADSAILAEHEVDYIFAPEPQEIYRDNFATYVTVDDISDKLEGVSRPGHFRGVSTIVTILFNTIRPDFAFFGQKDAQQVTVIKRLTLDLGFDTEIVVMPTIREKSGLAMSSRNERLSEEDRASASIIYKALLEAQIAIEGGECDVGEIHKNMAGEIAKETVAAIDYVAIVDNETLDPLEKIEERPVLIALAVKIGDVRLIDNMVVEPKQ